MLLPAWKWGSDSQRSLGILPRWCGGSGGLDSRLRGNDRIRKVGIMQRDVSIIVRRGAEVATEDAVIPRERGDRRIPVFEKAKYEDSSRSLGMTGSKMFAGKLKITPWQCSSHHQAPLRHNHRREHKAKHKHPERRQGDELAAAVERLIVD